MKAPRLEMWEAMPRGGMMQLQLPADSTADLRRLGMIGMMAQVEVATADTSSGGWYEGPSKGGDARPSSNDWYTGPADEDSPGQL